MTTTPPQPLIIAVDGHSSCGKSTVAKDIARELNIVYVDTGAMYRAITLFAIRNGMIDSNGINEPQLEKALPNIHITFNFSPATKQNITFLNGVNIEDDIRGLEVSQNVSAVSAIGFVRRHLVTLQRQMAQNTGLVMDGRDIGTVVFPMAQLKIFMTASPEIRAKRRYDELTAKGEKVDFNDILQNVVQRDHLDSTRAESPLKQAVDALALDNSYLSRQEQLDWIMTQLKNKNLI
ncbi:MAG: (d)CMP kinase [Marinilabiliaceae bacterium]|nr:(d)CMP kinase [Marinilabiliaceae bacterium]